MQLVRSLYVFFLLSVANPIMTDVAELQCYFNKILSDTTVLYRSAYYILSDTTKGVVFCMKKKKTSELVYFHFFLFSKYPNTLIFWFFLYYGLRHTSKKFYTCDFNHIVKFSSKTYRRDFLLLCFGTLSWLSSSLRRQPSKLPNDIPGRSSPPWITKLKKHRFEKEESVKFYWKNLLGCKKLANSEFSQ